MVPEGKDVRAIENPISAIFDLSDDVSRESEKIRKMIKYSKIYIGCWLFVNFLVIFSLLGSGALFWFIIAVALFVIGVLALRQLFRADRFFRYYVHRHKAIKSVRDADPVVLIPKGNTAARRLMTYLTSNDKQLSEAMSSGRATSKEQAVLKGRTGVFYNFDHYVYTSQSSLYRTLGIGEPGGAMYVKSLEKVPSVEDLNAVEEAIKDITLETHLPPRRIIVLWKRSEEESLDDKTYERLTTSVARIPDGRKGYVCAIQLVIENPDNTYEFIPFMDYGAKV